MTKRVCRISVGTGGLPLSPGEFRQIIPPQNLFRIVQMFQCLECMLHENGHEVTALQCMSHENSNGHEVTALQCMSHENSNGHEGICSPKVSKLRNPKLKLKLIEVKSSA